MSSWRRHLVTLRRICKQDETFRSFTAECCIGPNTSCKTCHHHVVAGCSRMCSAACADDKGTSTIRTHRDLQYVTVKSPSAVEETALARTVSLHTLQYALVWLMKLPDPNTMQRDAQGVDDDPENGDNYGDGGGFSKSIPQVDWNPAKCQRRKSISE